MLRRLLCILLTLCLLAGYAAAEDSATAVPTQEPPEGALVNGMVDGSGESAVQEMQERLIALGLLTGAADGHFGDGTEEALKIFQQMYGLEATGYADEATLAALSTAQEGVFEVQEALIAAGVTQRRGRRRARRERPRRPSPPSSRCSGWRRPAWPTPRRANCSATASNVVFGVQTKLIELAYLTGVADGVLGPATETAISEFQQMHALEVTGVADPATRELLQNGTNLTIKPTPTPSPRAHGAKGVDIELAQQRLAEWGFLSGTVDGHYGDDTEDAVKAFKSYQYEDMLEYLEANPTPTPAPSPTPTPTPTPAPGEMPMVYDATLPPEVAATPAPTPYAPDGEISDSLMDFFKADTFDVYHETVRSGDEGIEVERVQRRLHQLNYLYSADGDFGSLTENALQATSSARTTSTRPAWPTRRRSGCCSARTPLRARSTCSPTSWWWTSPTAASTYTAGRATATGSVWAASSAAWARQRRRRRRAPSRGLARQAGAGTTSRISTVTRSTPGAYRAAYCSTPLHTAAPTRTPAAPPARWAAPNPTAACA